MHTAAPRRGPDTSGLDLELADLLVELGDEGLVALLPLPIGPLKDAGRSLQESLLPGVDLARMHLEEGLPAPSRSDRLSWLPGPPWL